MVECNKSGMQLSSGETMNSREIINQVLNCDWKGCPPFLPAIYEHKSWFIEETPSAISRNVELFYSAVMKEYEIVKADALVIGVDVYSLEAEAVGCKVTFYEGDDTSIPGISPGNHLIKKGDKLQNRKVPNPSSDGRMPVNIEVTKRIVEQL